VRGWLESAILAVLFVGIMFILPIWLVSIFEKRKLFSGDRGWVFVLLTLAIPILILIPFAKIFDIRL
jgi:hypothetical protein